MVVAGERKEIVERRWIGPWQPSSSNALEDHAHDRYLRDLRTRTVQHPFFLSSRLVQGEEEKLRLSSLSLERTGESRRIMSTTPDVYLR
ncbi:hypothetical protein KPH14_003887 [Odynerus spinipes]|uniref:Uncharacterized protein n=1 Tax=Odynerus spinipes TaxID=1348599 RepID=A0AAD9RXJ5_9HYME|nr:hypothetical protein KPH14_003887 [Odynerus spinipes]